MACSFPSPAWSNLSNPGLQSAIENIADNSVALTYSSALPVAPGTGVWYNIYYSSDSNTLFDLPKLITTDVNVILPDSLVDLGYFYGVRASQIGVSSTISNTNLVPAIAGSNSIFIFPDNTALRADFDIGDTHILVDSIDGFPATDGYLLVGDEIIFYTQALASFSGGAAFEIGSRDPFGCNTIIDHFDGYEVGLFRGFENTFGNTIKSYGSCALSRPTWVNSDKVGIAKLDDLGNGTTLVASWGYAKAPAGFSKIYYNVYQSKSTANLTVNNPIGITSKNNAVISNVTPADGYYYAVRATYFVSNLNTTGMSQLGDDFFAFPDNTWLTMNLLAGQVGSVTVADTTGYPPAGLLRIGREVLQYSSKSSTTFVISRRDVFTLNHVEDFPSGEEVALFRGVEDDNTYFFRLTTSWDGYGVGALPLAAGDGYWGHQYLQDPDGYRNFPVDNINEDHSFNDEDAENAQQYDYCGYRNVDFVNLYKKNSCGTYAGGVINGTSGGIDVYEISNQRQELLLGLTGEPFVLLRRKWTGQTCRRLSHRNEHPHARCGLCYGTTFDGGYDRYTNIKELRPGEPNPNGFIQMRVSPYNEDIGLFQDRGLSQELIDLEAWTLSAPTIRDRDILIRFILDPETGMIMEDFRYEVLRVQRNKLMFSKDGSQRVTMKRLNRTEEIYKYPITLV